MSEQILDYYPILDGFLYKAALKCDLRFLAVALEGYEALRRSRGFAQRIITVPEDAGHTAIPNRNVFRYGQRVVPGSAFWAYSFVAPVGQFSVQVRDNCSDETLFSEVLLGSGTVSQQARQNPLPKLLVIGAPGLLDFEICSLSGTDTTGVQFLLWGGEPKFREAA
jgi:hypothetical protein